MLYAMTNDMHLKGLFSLNCKDGLSYSTYTDFRNYF